MSDPTSSFQPRVLVTGGGLGIGCSTVQFLLQKYNARVVVLSIEYGKAIEDLLREYPSRLKVVKGDVTSEADTDKAISTAQSDFGGLDGLVVCAAVEPKPTRIIDMAYTTYLRAITINVAGSFLSIQRSLPLLRAKDSGRPSTVKPRLLVLSSKADRGKQAGRVGYTSSKAALTSLIITLINEERESGVEVLGIYPGLTNTPLAKGLIERKHDDVMWPEEAENYKRWIEGGKVEEPEWCGEACAKLVVGASPGLPGQMARYNDHCPELKHGWWLENND